MTHIQINTSLNGFYHPDIAHVQILSTVVKFGKFVYSFCKSHKEVSENILLTPEIIISD